MPLNFQIETNFQVCLTCVGIGWLENLRSKAESKSENEVERETNQHWSRKTKSRSNVRPIWGKVTNMAIFHGFEVGQFIPEFKNESCFRFFIIELLLLVNVIWNTFMSSELSYYVWLLLTKYAPAVMEDPVSRDRFFRARSNWRDTFRRSGTSQCRK